LQYRPAGVCEVNSSPGIDDFAPELDPWLVRIKQVTKQTRETYVVTNNHFRGQAVVNAIEIKAALEEEPQPAPEPLFKVYPRLSESATPAADNKSGTLFD
jgi:hypothetical protein